MTRTLVACALCVAGSARAATVVHTTEAGFAGSLAPGYYLEDFGTLAGGQSWIAPGGNGYGFTAFANFGIHINGGGNPSGPSLSVSSPDDTILITFTGAPVTALGGWFSTVSLGGNPQMNVITLSDGTVEQFIGTGFRGFTSDVPITSFTFFGSDDPSYTRQWLDHLYVGSVVPSPAPVSLVALAGLGAIRRRR